MLIVLATARYVHPRMRSVHTELLARYRRDAFESVEQEQDYP